MEKPLLVHKYENLMYGLCIIVSITVAIYLLVSIVGAIIFTVIGLFSLFTHAISMSHIQVNGVRLKESQFPDLYKRVEELSSKMGLSKIPEVYIVESGGILNAFATKVFGFFGKNMVILYSDFVDVSIESNGHEIDYVIAHELAHIKRNHVVKALLVFPAMWIPFVGVSFSRMAEYTCDRMAAYYTERPEEAVNGLLVLAAGRHLYKKVNVKEYLEQYNDKKGVFVTLTELLSTHPPIPKRIHEIESLMYETPSVPLITRGKQTFAILFIIFFLFPVIIAGLTFAGIMAIEQFDFFEESYPSEYEYTPLMEASMDGDSERVSELISAGENLNEINVYGESPLLLAVVNEDLEIMQLLLENGADPNIQDDSGWTPLMSAVMTANLKVGQLLLESGADPLLVDVDDMSAIDHANEFDDNEYVQLINSYID